MRNQRGVTLVALITTIIVLIIIVSLSASTSMSTYKNMKYETFKAELQEVQEAVNKMCEDYVLAKEVSTTIDSYSTYFSKTYSSTPANGSDALSSATTVASAYSVLTDDSDYVYYFSQDDIKTYFGLEVTLKGVLVDFATKYVYSIEGCADPDDSSKTYYTLSEMDGETNIYENVAESASTLSGVTITTSSGSTSLVTSGNTKMLKITLTATRGATSGKDYPIKKAYYSTDGGTTYIEVDYLGDCVYSSDGDSVSFVIYEAGSYSFMLEDTYGKQVTGSVTID